MRTPKSVNRLYFEKSRRDKAKKWRTKPLVVASVKEAVDWKPRD